MFAARGDKPCVAISYDQSYSASYCLMSACADKIFVTPCGGVGSVGVWTAHTDISGMLDKAGVKITLIYSGSKKVDGNPLEPLSVDARDDIQTEVDRIREMFAESVAQGRGCPMDKVMGTEAAIYFADKGIPLMADYVGSMDDALAYLRGMVAKKQMEEPGDKEDWTDDNPNPDSNAVPPDAGTAAFPTGTSASVAARAALLGSGTLHTGSIGYRKTATTDSAWDGPANEARLKNDETQLYYKKFYTWVDSAKDDTKKSSYKFGHHMVSAGGDIGAANVSGCRAVIANLNGARSKPNIPSADRKGIYNHVAHHLRDAGVEPAPLKSESQLAAELASEIPISLLETVDRTGKLHVWDNEYLIPERALKVESLMSGLTTIRKSYPEAFAATRQYRASSNGPVNGSRKVSLLLAPYDSSANLGQFDERYRPGCFDNGGLSGDLRVLANHAESQSYVLGRVSANTAKFWSDRDGIHAEADAPDTTWANDLLVSMRRGDIRDASAAFYILKASSETNADGRKTRWIERALLVDGSVESFGAYIGATSQVADADQPQASATTSNPSPVSNPSPTPVLPSPVADPSPAPASAAAAALDHNRKHRARLAILRLHD
jgi:HK97 family phage prohead protease